MSSGAEARQRWSVRVAAADGERVIEVEATNEAEAARFASQSGATPLSVKPVSAAGKSSSLTLRHGPSPKKLAARLASELSLLMRSGMTLERALAALARLSSNAAMSGLADDLLRDVRAGKAFHEAVSARREILAPPFAEVCQAGEASGSLGAALEDLAQFLSAREKFDDQMRGAMVYPAFLMVGALIALTIMVTIVTPQFKSLFEGGALPAPDFTLAVFAVADVLAVALPVVLVLGVLSVFLVRWRLSDPGFARVWSQFWLNAPILGPFRRDALASRFTRLLALMLKNGLSAAPALRLAAASSGEHYAQERLNAAVDRVRTGQGFAEEIAAAKVLPEMVPELLSVGEEGGDLAGAAERLAEVYAEKVKRAADAALRLIEPAIIVGVGVLLGGMIISILLALVSANEAAF